MEPEHWTLDKRIPLGLIATILLQTLGMGWWAATLASRVEAVEKTQAAQIMYGERLTRLESVKEDVARRLDRIETKIDKILETWPHDPR